MTSHRLPPGPQGVPLLGNLPAFRKDPTGFLLHLAREYGDIAHFRLGRQHAFQLNHPDYIRDVLVTNSRNFHKTRGLDRAKLVIGDGLLTSEGDFHRRQRRLIQPMFHRDRLNAFGDIMVTHARQMNERWSDGGVVDMFAEMLHVTLSVVGETLFGQRLTEDTDRVRDAMATAFEYFNRLMTPFAGVLQRLPLPSRTRFEKARDFLDNAVYRMVAECRSDGEDRGDLLSYLVLALDEQGDGKGMDDRHVRDEIMTMFLAGHETTATALTWTWYLLAQHPDVRDELDQELDTVLGDKLPTVDVLPQLQYTRMVLAESMRLYPPVWTLTRRILEPYEVAGYVLPKGAVVGMSQYVMHRDPRYYPDPDRFDPLRWTAEETAKRPRYAYFPFGGGPRLCIGEPFAWMEATLLLATMCRQWRAELALDGPLTLRPLLTLRPTGGLPMTLRYRPRSTAASSPKDQATVS